MNSIIEHFDYLIENRFWLQKDKKYSVRNEFIRIYEKPSRYPAFRWREIFVLKSLTCWFEVCVRELTDEHLLKIRKDKKYSVVICGVDASIPIPRDEWGDPLKSNHAYYAMLDPFYIGKKYKYDFPYDEGFVPNDSSTSSILNKRFHNYDEAAVFASYWMKKMTNDHIAMFETEKEMLKSIEKIQLKG